MLGLKRGTVQLVKHNSDWKKVFELEAKKLKKIFGEDAIDIQHIGSTALKGMRAKPIIDIGLMVLSFGAVKRHAKELASAGYVLKENYGEKEMFFTKGPEEKRTCYLHIGEAGSGFIESAIRFRDILREDKKIAKEYSQLKEKLAIEYSEERKVYTKKKGEFIEKILSK